MRAVNLLPKDAERAARVAPNPALLLGVAGLAVVFAVLFSMYIGQRSHVNDQKDRVTQLQAQLAVLKPKAPPLKIQQQLAVSEPVRQQALSTALSYRLPWDVVLGQIAQALPLEISLTQLDASAPRSPSEVTSSVPSASTSSTSGPGVLTLTGVAPSQEAVAHLISRLSVLSSLSDVLLVQSGITSSGSSLPGSGSIAGEAPAPSYYSFTIAAHVREPGVSS